MRRDDSHRWRIATRLLIALLVSTAGIAVSVGGAAAHHGEEEPEEAPTSGEEICDEVFGGPHLGWWCQNNVAEPIDETVHEAAP